MALMCLVSVAFFASCDPEIMDPTITVNTADGYVQNNSVIDVNTDYLLGFTATSPNSTIELSKFYIDINGVRLVDEEISGTSFTYSDTLRYNILDRDIIDTLEIVATVVTNQLASASYTMTVYVNMENVLVPAEFTWNRHGAAAATGLEMFGLQWTSNGKEDFARITPLEGATLYKFEPETWANVTTAVEKAALFSEQTMGISVFNEVSAWTSHEYDFVIGTTYNGENYLIHITKGEVSTFKGTDITITGEWK